MIFRNNLCMICRLFVGCRLQFMLKPRRWHTAYRHVIWFAIVSCGAVCAKVHQELTKPSTADALLRRGKDRYCDRYWKPLQVNLDSFLLDEMSQQWGWISVRRWPCERRNPQVKLWIPYGPSTWPQNPNHSAVNAAQFGVWNMARGGCLKYEFSLNQSFGSR